MPKVYTEKPKSFEIEDFLLALSHTMGDKFILINPDDGMRIHKELMNIHIIGLSFSTPSKPLRKIGFLPSMDQEAEEEDQDAYEPEALLVLDVNPKSLPEGLKGEAWVLQVEDFEKLEIYRPIAEALCEFFKVEILMTPAHKGDDPDHMEERPVDEKLPVSPLWCPIIIRRVE